MSICVSVKVSEGLVLAADSTTAISGELLGPQRSGPGILKTYDNASKLSHLKDYPIGTLTWGTSLIGSRNVASLIKEYEYALPSLKTEQSLVDIRRRSAKAGKLERFKYSVRDITKGLRKHLSKFYNEEYGESGPNRPGFGVLVNGFSSGEFFPEQLLIQFPENPSPVEIRPDQDGKPFFGANWFGLTDAIVRLHWGRDEKLPQILAEAFNLEPKSIVDSLRSLQYPVPFDGMPLQDAIDYAVYLVNVVIGKYKFAVGVPLCGGEIDVAVITPEKLSWIRRKSWSATSTS